MSKPTSSKIEYTDDPETWMRYGGFRVRPFLNKDHLLAEVAVRRLSRENTSGLSIISKVATEQALINAKLALELNERGIHALIGNSCSCGLGIEVDRIRGDKPVTRADRERILFKLPAHLNTKTFRGAGVDLIRGVIKWPKRSFWIQPAGRLIRTRWVCWEKGDLGLAEPGEDGSFGWPPTHTDRGKHWSVYANLVPRVWSDKQAAQIDRLRTKAETKNKVSEGN